jgi:hypothetical protein
MNYLFVLNFVRREFTQIPLIRSCVRFRLKDFADSSPVQTIVTSSLRLFSLVSKLKTLFLPRSLPSSQSTRAKLKISSSFFAAHTHHPLSLFFPLDRRNLTLPAVSLALPLSFSSFLYNCRNHYSEPNPAPHSLQNRTALSPEPHCSPQLYPFLLHRSLFITSGLAFYLLATVKVIYLKFLLLFSIFFVIYILFWI